MKYLKINLKNIKKEQIDKIVDYFRRGKVVVYPTDTVYGLGCDATNKKAVEKILKIKKREKDKGLVVLIKSYCMLHDYCQITSKQEKYIRSIWPPTTLKAHSLSYKKNKNPTTFILGGKNNLAPDVYGEDESLAVRLPFNSVNLPKKEFLITILKDVNRPIVSTSLNISGQKTLKNVQNIDKYFKKYKPDLVIDAGRITGAKPSKMIDVKDMENIRILRK